MSRLAELVSCEVSINAMPWTNSRSVTYWILFVGAFLAVAVKESFRPRRVLSGPAERRWSRHAVLLAGLSTLFQKVILQVNPVIVAALVANSRIGILNRPWLPFAVRCAATVVLLDLARYLIHRTYHAVGFLWRIHEVHHSDPDYDVSTAGRFPSLEVLVDQGAILATIALLAPPVSAVFAAELVTLLLNFFARERIAARGGRSGAARRDCDSGYASDSSLRADGGAIRQNLGQTFSWWDRLLGTYRGNPAAGDEGLVTGVKGLQNAGQYRTRIHAGRAVPVPLRISSYLARRRPQSTTIPPDSRAMAAIPEDASISGEANPANTYPAEPARSKVKPTILYIEPPLKCYLARRRPQSTTIPPDSQGDGSHT